MFCITCGSGSIASISAKCSDMCEVDVPTDNFSHSGYVPNHMGVGRGHSDYVEFRWCLTCGQIQDEFPMTDYK